MRVQNSPMYLFRFLALMMVIALAFSQSAGIAQAQEQPPQREKPAFETVSLDGVEGYYGPLAKVQGTLGIVIELEDEPSALVYAKSQGKSSAQLSAITRDQTRMIVGNQTNLMRALQAQGIRATELYRTQKVFNGIWLKVESGDINKLSQMPGVKAIYPMIPKQIDHTTSVPLIGALQAWAGSGTFQGQGITVGIIDTGIDYQHTMFGGTGASTFPTAKVVGGYDFAGDAYDANDDLSVPAPDLDPMDCNGHGSHVSGTVAGFGVLTDGSTFVEGAGDTYADLAALAPAAYQAKFRIGPGVAPKAELYGLRIFGCEGTTNLTEQAIEWAIDPNNDDDFSDHLDVINMSLGSSYGSEYDTSALASNNAVAAGVIVVASAGNSGDVFYITGAPGLAKHAISVANSQDSSAMLNTFDVTTNSAPTPVAPVGTYPAGTSVGSFGPNTYDVTGDLVYTTPADGCTAISQDLTGKIALIDRGTCAFTIKVKNAQLKGAAGVLIVNNANGFPPGLGGTDATVTIPAMSTTLATGTNLKADLTGGALTVRLYTSGSTLAVDSQYEDVISSSSSRGISRGQNLKPDVSAPGDTIFSAATGTGDEGASFTGTSMAAPHVSGVMALLKQANPTWGVADLKALVMNTATNEVFSTTAKTVPLTPSRQGAGRVNIPNALGSPVVAYLESDPGQVSVSFGAVAVSNVQTFSKVVEVKNTSASAITYDLSMVERYQPNAGLVFSTSAPSVTVPAGGTAQFTVYADVNAVALVKAIDPTIATVDANGYRRQRMSEGGGFVLLESTGTEPDLRVPVYIAARSATAMSVMETEVSLPAALTGILELTPSGSDAPYQASNVPLVAIMELMGQSPDEVSSTLTLNAADLKYVGVSYYNDPASANDTIYFGIATHGNWETPNTYGGPEFDIYIDVDEDGIDDYLVFNADSGLGTTTRNDNMMAWVVDLHTGNLIDQNYLNDASGTTDTAMFNNNVMLIPVYPGYIDWDIAANPDFNFTVETYHRDAAGMVDSLPIPMSYNVDNQAFDAGGWFNIDSPDEVAFEVAYDKEAIGNRGSLGLLLLHMHNATETTEVLPLANSPVFSKTAPIDLATNQSLSPTLSWETSDGATSYEYCYSSVPGPCTKWNSVGTDTSVTLSGLSPNYTYYWQVRAVSAGAIQANVSTWWSFTTTAALACTFDPYTPPTTPSFVDVPEAHWAWNWIERFYSAGLTTGCAWVPGGYCPGDMVTREQMAVFIMRAKNCGAYTPAAVTGPVFTDVPASHWAAGFIRDFADEGITTGCSWVPGGYCPGDLVTREQMAVFVIRATHGGTYSPPAVTGPVFTDVPASHWAATFIKQFHDEGITTGCAWVPGGYCPGDLVTREQMAVFIGRAFHLP